MTPRSLPRTYNDMCRLPEYSNFRLAVDCWATQPHLPIPTSLPLSSTSSSTSSLSNYYPYHSSNPVFASSFRTAATYPTYPMNNWGEANRSYAASGVLPPKFQKFIGVPSNPYKGHFGVDNRNYVFKTPGGPTFGMTYTSTITAQNIPGPSQLNTKSDFPQASTSKDGGLQDLISPPQPPTRRANAIKKKSASCSVLPPRQNLKRKRREYEEECVLSSTLKYSEADIPSGSVSTSTSFQSTSHKDSAKESKSTPRESPEETPAGNIISGSATGSISFQAASTGAPATTEVVPPKAKRPRIQRNVEPSDRVLRSDEEVDDEDERLPAQHASGVVMITGVVARLASIS
ncbi:hypothetical protein CPB84DRAFT_1852776 [Gymnopilus junonius]|uniref:Uncharacterized protein n=1 Tax=Gymnopilus junonius TaxID=109634 RepID=A0A9P5TH59_GYMJU|nr:hypothetical protein CPB84DRAFT_1852776 [Gymnopilus junonius]